MLELEEVGTIRRLHALGWGAKRIAKELRISRNTARRYLRGQGWEPYRRARRSCALDGLEGWLKERFERHRGNAAVVHQELLGECAVAVSLRTVERACAGFRQAWRAEARATLRFETPPGEQLQIDFGEVGVVIGGEARVVHLFVATLGYSRRQYVRAFTHQRQSAWFDGLEGAFDHFGGIAQVVLLDNAKALVERHDVATGEVRFNERLLAFARHWGFHPRACAPYRARTKGKDERSVGYVKGNAIAGRTFATWAALEGHLAWWLRHVADIRVHATTGESPAARFARAERSALTALAGRPAFALLRELVRRVHTDACVEIDTNRYSVPWRLIGERVTVQLDALELRVMHAGGTVAIHRLCHGRRERRLEASHLSGIVGHRTPRATAKVNAPAVLLRPLAEYEALLGGGF